MTLLRTVFAWSVLFCGATGPAACSASAYPDTMLEDSTVVASWRLPNGLTVSSRHVPLASSVAITVGYRVGSAMDPADRPGLAVLLAEVLLTAPAGEIPWRSRAEMESLRPLGWSLKVLPRTTLISEVASLDQFPGVLRQVATRMRGVTVTKEVLNQALASIRGLLAESRFGDLHQALYHQARLYGSGLTSEAVTELAGAKRLQSLSVRTAQEWLVRWHVPSNAVVTIAGNLDGFELPAMIENELGGIPAGTVMPGPPQDSLRAIAKLIRRPEIASSSGVIGLIAPALQDTLHPSFVLSMILLGEACKRAWPAPGFHYAFLDEPDLVRFYPPVKPGTTDPIALSEPLDRILDQMHGVTILTREDYDQARSAVLWLLGGSMPRSILRTMRTSPAALNTLANSMASRELSGSETFWAEYRRRFDPAVSPAFGRWVHYATAPEHQIRLLFAPDP